MMENNILTGENYTKRGGIGQIFSSYASKMKNLLNIL